MPTDGRNTLPGIAERVHKNLAFLVFAKNMGADVHVVTQLLLSLLGLVVFPFEELRRQNKHALQDIPLSALSADGWPEWKFTVGASSNLGNLLFHLRNAVSHHRLLFSSDSRILEEVQITFRDRMKPTGPDNWEATIEASDLRVFVELLSDFFAKRSYGA